MDVDPQVLNGDETRAAAAHSGVTRCNESGGPQAYLHKGLGAEDFDHRTVPRTHRKDASPRSSRAARSILVIVFSMALVAAMTGLFIIGWSHAYVG